MTEVLFVNACLREDSRTMELAQRVLDKLEGSVEEVRLYEREIRPLDTVGMKKRAQAVKEQDFSDDLFVLAKQFANAQTIVVAAPYWDLMFPAILKTYLENVSIAGLTFVYSQQGFPIGLCKAGKLYYVTTSGGVIGKNDFGFAYIKALATNLFGIENVEGFAAEELDISEEKTNAAMKEAKRRIDAAFAKE